MSQERGEGGSTPPSFCCPECGAVSYHPVDISERYCGFCHRFADEPRGDDDAEDQDVAEG